MARFNHLNIPTEWEQYWSKYPEGYTMLEALIDWTGQVDEMVDYINASVDGDGNTVDLSTYLKKTDFELYLITSTTIKQLQQDIIDLQGGTGGGSVDLSEYAKIADLGMYIPAPDVFTPINAMLQEWGYADLPELIQTINELSGRVANLENV